MMGHYIVFYVHIRSVLIFSESMTIPILSPNSTSFYSFSFQQNTRDVMLGFDQWLVQFCGKLYRKYLSQNCVLLHVHHCLASTFFLE